MIGAANRDPDQFTNPDRLDITRDPNRHVTLGHGVHYCLGAAFARLELRVAVAGFLDRFPESAGERQIVFMDRTASRRPTSVPVFARCAQNVLTWENESANAKNLSQHLDRITCNAFSTRLGGRGGIKTRYVQAGNESNPPLIMLHGTAGSLENFAANIAAHARHFNCVAFDMIGSGMTAKPDYDYETEHYVAHVVDISKQ